MPLRFSLSVTKSSTISADDAAVAGFEQAGLEVIHAYGQLSGERQVTLGTPTAMRTRCGRGMRSFW